MSRFLKSLMRCVMALSLWFAVTAAGAFAGPGTAVGLEGETFPESGRIDARVAFLALVTGADQICGNDLDQDEDALVLCGGEQLAGLYVDGSAFVMSRGTCSRLLETLYEEGTCDPELQNCGQYQHGAPPPTPNEINMSGVAPVTLVARYGADGEAARRLLAQRPGSERAPPSRAERPDPPPPRSTFV